MTEALQAALTSFASAIGEEFVVTDEQTRKQYETATFYTGRSIPAILRPGNVEEVQECMRIATAHNIKVYPFSTGLNVGYGSKVPTADNCVVLELKRLNRILDFSKDLAYVTLEPGVTQQQLYDHIQEQGGGVWMDSTGSFTRHSIIGNIAERGFGHTSHADHFANVGGLEVVLPSGELLHTGFGRFENAKAAGLYRAGVGPSIEGLFGQSNLGIITRVTLWLMPEPEYVQNFACSVMHDEQLGELIDLLRPLRLNRTIASAMHIGNDYKFFTAIMRYPWERSGGVTPMSKELLNEYAKEWGFGAWNVSGALYGTRQEVASARKRIKRQLRGKVVNLRFIDQQLLKVAGLVAKPYQWVTGMNLPEMLKLIKPVFGMTQGIPSDDVIPSTYWRVKGEIPPDPDPDRDGCGLMWLAPVAPTGGEHARAIWDIVNETMPKYGFEPSVSITTITERAMDCVINIAWDRSVEGEDERAQQCHDDMLGQMTAKGYYPYRLGIHSMAGLPESRPSYADFMSKLKESVDPGRVLAPGRYE